MRKGLLGVLFLFVTAILVGCVPQSDLPIVDGDNEPAAEEMNDNEAADVEINADADVDADGEADEDMDDVDEENADEDGMNEENGEEGDDEGEGEEDADADQPKVGTYEFDIENTEVTWEAWKVVGGHNGVVNMQEGVAIYEEGKLVGGEAVIDMTTILSTDNGGNEGLDDHLRSEDFFAIETFPTATIEITNVEYTNDTTAQVTADLTIKGVTNPITFTMNEKEQGFTADLMIDRIAYDIRYNSANFFQNLGDKAIKDDFAMSINAALTATGE